MLASIVRFSIRFRSGPVANRKRVKPSGQAPLLGDAAIIPCRRARSNSEVTQMRHKTARR